MLKMVNLIILHVRLHYSLLKIHESRIMVRVGVYILVASHVPVYVHVQMFNLSIERLIG